MTRNYQSAELVNGFILRTGFDFHIANDLSSSKGLRIDLNFDPAWTGPCE